nr:hypothetical protein [Pontibacter aquaedesilientis]
MQIRRELDALEFWWTLHLALVFENPTADLVKVDAVFLPKSTVTQPAQEVLGYNTFS